MFHLGWFYGFQVQSWNGTWSGSDGATEWMTPDMFVEAAQAMERAGFDCMVIEDALFVQDIYKGSAEFTLSNAFMAPKHDPMPYVPVMAAGTKHLGFIPTVTTSFYPPFLAARLLSTLDHVTGGRVGANLVMSHNDRTAQNFGLDGQAEHDHRYEMGDEWVELVNRLWGSWEPDALVLDEEAHVYADHTKVSRVDFEGSFYRSRGPLNTAPSPQGRPVLCQAGGSPRGRDFAARNADILLSNVQGIEAMKEYRDDIRARAAAFGRDPDDIKIVFLVSPVLGATDAEATRRWDRMVAATEQNLEANLAFLSYYSGIDYSTLDLDAPIPHLSTNASRSTIAHTKEQSAGQTLREYASHPVRSCVELIGSPDTVAERMGEVAEEVGGDGFLISLPLTRRTIAEVTDGLAPALRARGLIRDGYPHATLRETLKEF
ncbi:NtaA/DmoA family FMN-dependent monooxygenase [Herbiconiux moechotypicola]|uniref:NtaA/DmoA family FMN-dependent monooxygenase n=1 Tax=Herbiconiux moechotypicola TaxID=637393 RepID=A0ABP5QG15_9MICO|nr:NtaA/DmoA family FMN-dependent monooxygenase [Herbiconiux moechotypicola]MCS5730060.1 NtaA/DmoA family FMN-dependent monooxygenase [Herbiconiux moechotypicola]